MFSTAPTIPTLTWVSRKVALFEDTTMSASTTKCSPADATVPLTAQMTGFHTRFCLGDQNTSSVSGPLPALTLPRAATAPMSAPVQKWRLPAAVTMAHRIQGSSRTSAQIALTGSIMEPCSALPRSGRLMVMWATWSRRS